MKPCHQTQAAIVSGAVLSAAQEEHLAQCRHCHGFLKAEKHLTRMAQAYRQETEPDLGNFYFQIPPLENPAGHRLVFRKWAFGTLGLVFSIWLVWVLVQPTRPVEEPYENKLFSLLDEIDHIFEPEEPYGKNTSLADGDFLGTENSNELGLPDSYQWLNEALNEGWL